MNSGFVSWKISSENIFLAYEMLVKEYKYILSKLYPEGITDPEKQSKMFEELLACFDEKTKKITTVLTDTSKKQLLFYKNILTHLQKILLDTGYQDETLFSNLKKLEQNNNSTALKQNLESTIKMLTLDKYSPLYEALRPVLGELWMFIIPKFWLRIMTKVRQILSSLDPLIHPEHDDIHKKSHIKKLHDDVSVYDDIENNSHIHVFLQKKYRASYLNCLEQNSRKFYLYTFFREKKLVYFFVKSIKFYEKILIHSLILFLLLLLASLFIDGYHVLFFTNEAILFFIMIVLLSLVFQNETV